MKKRTLIKLSLAIVMVVFFIFGFISSGEWWARRSARIKKIQLEGEGQARLLKSLGEKKITIEEAKAKLESARFLAQADIERAKGVAQANKIIGDSLKENEAYLRYLWIQNMNTKSEVIYIPTEAGIPILEAGKRKKND